MEITQLAAGSEKGHVVSKKKCNQEISLIYEKVSSATPRQDESDTSSETAQDIQTFAKLKRPLSPVQIYLLNTSKHAFPQRRIWRLDNTKRLTNKFHWLIPMF